MPKTHLSRLLSKKFHSIIKLADVESKSMESNLSEDEQKSLDQLADKQKCDLVCDFLEKWLPAYMEQHQLNFKHLFGGIRNFLFKQEIKVPELFLSWRNCRVLAEQQAKEATISGRELP